MRNIYTIFKKEVRSYFNSPAAYIVVTFFLLFAGYFFGTNIFLMNQASLRTAFGIIPLVFIFFVPAITMRLIAEERKSGTIELLVTYPIKDIEIILGKFLAALALLAVALVFTWVYAITISRLGNLDEGQVIGGYFGLLLMGGAYLAIGIFASALTENQIIAFIVALVIIFVFFLLDKILFFIPAPLVSIFEYLSIDYHFENISRGVIDTRDLLYYFSVIFFGLLLASHSLSRRKGD
jgi:ABC-2 type transport system permease protein